MQKTVKKTIKFSGIGLHTGANVSASILPSAGSTGITFVRTDLPGRPSVRATASNVVATSYATTLGAGGVTISTIEHLMAAFYGLGVDNAVVELDGPEVPILDGSSDKFIEMIDSAGLRDLDTPRNYLVIKKPIKVSDYGKYVLLLPSEEEDLSIDYSIEFSHPFLAKQTFSRHFSIDVFRKELGRARTFGFLHDVEKLRAHGLAKGGSLSNAVVISDNKILNEGGLRYPDEFVRHKVLDMMGDISLLGVPVIGRLIAHRSGHSLNNRLVHEILANPGSWELVSAPVEESASAAPVYEEKMATA